MENFWVATKAQQKRKGKYGGEFFNASKFARRRQLAKGMKAGDKVNYYITRIIQKGA